MSQYEDDALIYLEVRYPRDDSLSRTGPYTNSAEDLQLLRLKLIEYCETEKSEANLPVSLKFQDWIDDDDLFDLYELPGKDFTDDKSEVIFSVDIGEGEKNMAIANMIRGLTETAQISLYLVSLRHAPFDAKEADNVIERYRTSHGLRLEFDQKFATFADKEDARNQAVELLEDLEIVEKSIEEWLTCIEGSLVGQIPGLNQLIMVTEIRVSRQERLLLGP